jgi:hypothetical protein
MICQCTTILKYDTRSANFAFLIVRIQTLAAYFFVFFPSNTTTAMSLKMQFVLDGLQKNGFLCCLNL